MTLEAQCRCKACGGRNLVLITETALPGQTVQTNTYCDCEEPQENAITVVYDPDEYDLVDPYGDGDIGLEATCEDCGIDLHGPVAECLECGGTDFERRLTEVGT